VTPKAPNQDLWRMNEHDFRGEIRNAWGWRIAARASQTAARTSRQRGLHRIDALKQLPTLRLGWRRNGVGGEMCFGKKGGMNMKF